jgi:hypothetical protein
MINGINVVDNEKNRAALERARKELMTPHPGGLGKLAEDLLAGIIDHVVEIENERSVVVDGVEIKPEEV